MNRNGENGSHCFLSDVLNNVIVAWLWVIDPCLVFKVLSIGGILSGTLNLANNL